MAKVIFKFDKEKDLWNNWYSSNHDKFSAESKQSGRIKKICEGKKFDECRGELYDQLVEIQNSKILKIDLRLTEKAWKKIEREFFTKMDNIMKKKFMGDITAYLTTAGICPYDFREPSFMFSLFYSLPKKMQIFGHEIMHIYFHKFYWNKIESEIGTEKTEYLKEALTVLLNVEFKDLWIISDRGYNSHKELRKFILEEWKKEKDFEKLLDKCTRYLKNRINL